MNLFRGVTSQSSANVASLFEIRINSTDRDLIILRGSAAECTGSVLQGVLVLSLSDSIQARNINLTLVGKTKSSWSETYMTASHYETTRYQKEEKVVFEKSWSFLPVTSHSKTIGVGNYEYPFSADLPGDIPETIEGLEFGSINYVLQATVDRPGFATNLTSRKQIRILRTLSPDTLEMAHTLSIDNTWPDKIEYSINIPTKSYPLGSRLPISFNILSLLKGVSIPKIAITLKEYQVYLITRGLNNGPGIKEVDRTICTTTVPDLDPNATQWVLEHSLQIPSALTECVQDCEAGQMKIRHKLKFVVSIMNPDGHISELRAALPVTILLPPQLFGGIDFSFLDPTNPRNQLPTYDSHIYDRLYDGLETPLPSGMNTPATSRSRSNSIDVPVRQENEISHRALMDGLSSLTSINGQRSTPVSISGSYGNTGSTTPVSGSATPYRFAPGSYSAAFTSDELAASLGPEVEHRSVAHSPNIAAVDIQNPPPLPFSTEDLEALNRIPSYSTATTRAAAGPISNSLPDYNMAEVEETGGNTASGVAQELTSQPLARPPVARVTSHRSGVLRTAHDRLTRSRNA